MAKKQPLPPPSITLHNKGQTYYVIDFIDFSDTKPRFGLYIDLNGKPIKKSNNPYDFDKIVFAD